MRPALIIIDMQEGSFTPRDIRHDSAGLVERLSSLAQPWRYHAPLRVVLAALAVRAALVVI